MEKFRKNNKILVFEGAGCEMTTEDLKISNIVNYRIRTAFRNKKGQEFYFEASSGWEHDNNKRIKSLLIVNYFFRADIKKDKENNSTKKIHEKLKEIDLYKNKKEFTKENILNLLNENFDCDFKSLEVVCWYDYTPFIKNSNKYLIMNDVKINKEKSKAIKETFDKTDKELKEKNKSKYSCCSIRDVVDNVLIIHNHKENETIKRDLIY